MPANFRLMCYRKNIFQFLMTPWHSKTNIINDNKSSHFCLQFTFNSSRTAQGPTGDTFVLHTVQVAAQNWWETGRFIDTQELSPPLPSIHSHPLINKGTKSTRVQMLVSCSHQLCQPPMHSLIDSDASTQEMLTSHKRTLSTQSYSTENVHFKGNLYRTL